MTAYPPAAFSHSVSAHAEQEREVRLAARALGRHHLAHAYGHCSMRLSESHFLVCSSQPMGLIAPGVSGSVVPLTGPLPPSVLGEVRIHQQIYARRLDVKGIVRSMPPSVMSLGTTRRTPRPLHGMGSYFGEGAALWDDPQLVRDDAKAAELAQTLGSGVAIVMRGNGAVVVASNLPKAVCLTWYLEDAARIELQVRSAGLDAQAVVLSPEECRLRATDAGGIFERMWQYLIAGDPEIAQPDAATYTTPIQAL